MWCGGIALLFLGNQRWFWTLAFGLGALASFFAMIASVFYFQILGAVGFCVLMCILFAITMTIGEDYFNDY